MDFIDEVICFIAGHDWVRYDDPGTWSHDLYVCRRCQQDARVSILSGKPLILR